MVSLMPCPMPKKHLLLILLFLGTPIFAQVTQRNILLKQYSPSSVEQMIVKREQWKPYPRTTSEWQAAAGRDQLDLIIKAGEEAMAKPIPPISASVLLEFVRTGDRSKHGAVSFGRRNQLMELILAESVEDQGRFTEAIMNLVWEICEESYWGVPAHLSVQKAKNGLPDAEDPTVDLFGAETASVLAWADYFVGEKLDKLSPLLRKRIYYEVNRKIFEPLKQPQRYGWLSKTVPVNNWNPWIVSNLLVADLLLEKNEEKRSENVHTYLGFLDLYLNGLGEDGGCDEGPSYWFAAGACVFDALETLSSASNGKIDIYKEPLVQKMAAYVYKVHIADDYFVNFADADPKLRPDGLMLYRFGKALHDPQLVAFGKWAYDKFGPFTGGSGYHRSRKIQNLLTINPIKQDHIPAFSDTKTAWFSDIQVLTARSENGLFLAAHGGHNAESHNHNDVGDFIVYADGEPVIIDAGRGNYTARTFSPKRYELWFTRSEYHNLPIINGQGQLAGRRFEAQNVVSTINGKEAAIRMDIAPAYKKEAGIRSLNRTVRLNFPKNTIEVADEYAMAQKPDTLTQVFMTVCDTDLSSPGKIIFKTPGKKTVSLTYDPKLWVVSSEFPSTDGMEYSSFKTKWDSHPVQRILLTSKAPKQNGKYGFVISKINH
jgi:hypothetical protein